MELLQTYLKLSTALHGTTENFGAITRIIHPNQENQMIKILVPSAP